MTAHTCTTHNPACFRCALSIDEWRDHVWDVDLANGVTFCRDCGEVWDGEPGTIANDTRCEYCGRLVRAHTTAEALDCLTELSQ